MTPPKQPCTRCGDRWARWRGLCATCRRATGNTSTTREREAIHLAKIAPRRVVPPESRAPRPDRVVTINGHDYAVVWDGA